MVPIWKLALPALAYADVTQAKDRERKNAVRHPDGVNMCRSVVGRSDLQIDPFVDESLSACANENLLQRAIQASWCEGRP